MANTLEDKAKAPTAYEQALEQWSIAAPDDHLRNDQALYFMVTALAQELADEREINRDQSTLLAQLRRQLSLLRSALDVTRAAFGQALKAEHVIQAGTAQPTMRMRLNHTHSKADGWKLAETTVEWSGPGAPDEEAIAAALITAAHFGQREAVLRNAPPVADEDGGR